jgi:hypothetical protein
MRFNIDWIADRVQWFEVRASKDRWREEVEILEADIGRCSRFFETYQAAWEDLSKGEVSRGTKAYCLKVSNMFLELRNQFWEPKKQRYVDFLSIEMHSHSPSSTVGCCSASSCVRAYNQV